MKVEILFPEICNLYGDAGNVMLIEKTLTNATIIKTSILDEPYFAKHKVNFVYMGPMSPNNQKLVIEKLMPYKDKIKKMINDGVVFLFTGNAMEVLGKEIVEDDKSKVKGLGILKVTSKIDEANRYHSLFLGKLAEVNAPIVGYFCQSNMTTIKEKPLFEVTKQIGNPKSEGLRVKNFFATNLLGPILVLNPYFAKYLFSLIKYNKPLYLETELIDAYNKRVEEYEREDIKL